jgi:hypothetical protein
MTPYQKFHLHFIFSDILKSHDIRFDRVEFHHGDCVGVDTEAANMAFDLGYYTVSHSPLKDDLIGDFISDEYRKSLTYFARNRNIVDECDFLLVVPYQMEHQKHGGTWYTHDYAVKKTKPFKILWPEDWLV